MSVKIIEPPNRKALRAALGIITGLSLSAVATSSWAQPEPAAPAATAVMPTSAAPPAAPAEEPATDEPEGADAATVMGGDYRQVNDHIFVMPSFFDNAFTNTNVRFTQGFGTLELQSVNLQTGATESVNAFMYRQRLAGLIGIANRVGIGLFAGGDAAINAGEVEQVLAMAAIAAVHAGGGVKVRIYTFDFGLQISVGTQAYYSREFYVSPIRVALSAAGLDVEAVPQLEQFVVAPALMLAEGVGPFGIQITTGPDIGAAGDADYKTTTMNVGAHILFDVGRLTEYVPFGITGEYQMIYDTKSSADIHKVSAGFWFTGRRDLAVGSAFVANLTSSEEKRIGGQITLQYFF